MAEADGIRHDLERLLRSIREGRPLKPIGSLESIRDSDIMASILGSAFTKAGYKVRIKMVRQPQFEEFHHVFIEVFDPTTSHWIAVDPQRTEPGDWDEEKAVQV